MDENKNLNIENGMDENENLFAQKKENAPKNPAGAYPAYRSRRADVNAASAPKAQETVVRPPVRKPAELGVRQAPPSQRGVQRRPAPASGASAQGQAARPSAPKRPAQTPATPVQQIRRPAPNAPDQRAAQSAPSAQQKAVPQAAAAPSRRAPQASPAPQPAPARREDAAYMARRSTPATEASQGAAKETVVAHAPFNTPNDGRVAMQKAEPVQPKNKKTEKKKPEAKSESNAAQGATIMVNIVKAMAYMVLILVVSVFISIFVIRVGNDVFAFVKSDEAVDVTIPENADAGDIADILSDNGIINFPGIFKFYTNYKDKNGEYVAGDYTVSPSMSYDELRRAFKEQVVTGTVWITIPEGYTTDEIIDLMVENGIGERAKYIDVINNYDFDYWFVDDLEKSQLKDGRVYRLEGYLFPDTYEFYKSSSEEMVINRLLARFDEVFVKDYRTKAEELGYTVDEILTIASLVEKEAGSMGDFMYVSSVFHNRLNNPTYYPRLESDATTVYAIQLATGKRPDKITPEDNKFEHPYNTYLNSGLTPGPITNPSASAIRYALYPADSNYYYFITDNAGKVYYGANINEHNQNIETVRRVNEELAG